MLNFKHENFLQEDEKKQRNYHFLPFLMVALRGNNFRPKKCTPTEFRVVSVGYIVTEYVCPRSQQ